MKSVIYFIIVLTILPSYRMLSQVNEKLGVRPYNLLQERIIPHSISDERIKHLTQTDIFKEGESRTLVNKTILDNGFLLIEELR